MNTDLSVRTPAEELWLWRRDKGLTTAASAARFGVGRCTYWRIEDGRRGLPKSRWKPVDVPPDRLLFLLARRRARLTTSKLARKLGISRVTLLARERCGDAGLRLFWENYGFKFPVSR